MGWSSIPKRVNKLYTISINFWARCGFTSGNLLQSTKIQRQMGIPTDQYWNMMLDEMVGVDEERLMALEAFLR